MRKSNLLMLLWAVLLVTLLPINKTFGQEAYAVFENGTLTLKYDDQRPNDAYDIRSNDSNGWSDIASNITKVVFDDSFKDYSPTSCAAWFYGCTNLTEIVGMKDNLNTASVTRMNMMFCECSKLTSLDLSMFDTQSVTAMASMFNNCSSLITLDLSKFDTQIVKSMFRMFYNCSKLKTIYVGDNWTTDNVTSSDYMFSGCNKLYGSKGTNLYDFELTDKTYAKIDGGETAPGYLTKIGESIECDAYAYALLENGTLTFYYDKNKPDNAIGLGELTESYTNWKSNVTKVVFNESFKIYNPNNCMNWFNSCNNLTEIEGMKENLNTSEVKNMGSMFYNCSNLTSLDLSGFDTQNVTSMSSMFRYCRQLQTIFIGDNWSTDAVEVSQDLFTDCNNLYGGQGSTVEECELTDKTYAKIDGGASNPGYFTKSNDIPYTASSIEITTLPQKNKYYQGEMLNLSEGILTITFADKPTKTIPLRDAEIIFDNMKPGNQAVIVKYLGKETSYDVYVIDISDGPYYNNREESFEITTANELLWFANHANTVNNEANAILKNDIVVNENLLEKIENEQTSDLISWIPIGTKENPYKGGFVTDKFSISGLYFNNPQKDYVGFFGYCDNVNAYNNYFLIKDSFFAGHNYVGGIIGYGSNVGIQDSYFRGIVSGNKNVGGLIGYRSDEFHNSNTEIWYCYVSAKVIGNENVGSICGVVDGDSYPYYCYYNTSLSTIGAINGKDNTERNLKGINNFHSGEAAYAMHIYQDLSDPSSWPEFKGKRVHRNLSGEGYHNAEYEEHHCKHCINYTYTLPPLVGDVYQISNADELYGFMHIVNSGNTHANAILTQDIVVNENVLEKVKSGETLDLREWYSIGDGDYLGYHNINCRFAGVFDGNFHTISGLYFNNKVIDGEVQVGFVSSLLGTIKNIIVTDTYFESITSVSGIACFMLEDEFDVNNHFIQRTNPLIENCIFDGEINSNGSAAGICYSHSGSDNGLIKNCINYGKISGSSYSGGILGADWGAATIINCYNVGEIICKNKKEGIMYTIGGIYGGTNGGSISSCFNTGLISCDYSISGYHWGNLTISNTYNNQDVCNLPLTSSDNTTITGGGQTTSDYLCNGELPEGFSSSDWIPGNTETDGDVTFYTFPHLKVFDGIYPAYTLKKEPQAVAITLTTPTKTEYFEKENLDLSGGELLVSYDNSKTEKVELSKATISGFDNTKLGEQTIKVSYLDLETEFKVTVVAFAPVSIDISKLPIKLQYLENEELNINDGELLITYNDNTTEKVALNKAIISGFDKTKIGEQTLTVVFNNLETTFNVNVKAKTAIALEITATPSKLEYFEGEAFVADGGEFVVTYDNKTSETFSLSKAKISGYNANLIGEQNLTVEYLGQKAELKVTIKYKNPYTEPAISAEDNSYQISTAEELLWFMFDVNHGDVKANAALVNDIIINKDCLKRITEMLKATSKAGSVFTPWQPIGTTENPYQGTFDGQGHTISGIYIDDNTQSNVGLFGSTAKDAVIKNLGVTDSYIAGNENVGAICGKSEGTVVNCYTVSEVKGSKNVNPLVGAKETAAVVENCYYLAETPVANDPCAKTAEEFLSGNVAQLLSQGAVVNGVTYSGETFAGVTELPGTDIIPQPENNDNPSTSISSISENNIKVWSFNHTIYIEDAPADTQYTIIDLNGRVITTSTTKSTKEEVNINKSGVVILIINNISYKLSIN